jgi:transcriptional regulator of acetoin/glycerol metabolism
MQIKRTKTLAISRQVEPRSFSKVDVDRTLKEHVQPLVEKVEREHLKALLLAHDGRIAASAQQAGISRRTLLRKLREYGIDKSDFK